MTLFAIAAIPACAFLNRLRGGGFFDTRINGKLFVAPFMAALAWIIGLHTFWPGWWDPLLFGALWLLWAYPRWSRWMALGHSHPSIHAPDISERAIEWLGHGNAYACLLLRHTIFLLPMWLAFGWAFLALGPVVFLSYVVGWAWFADSKSDALPLCEWISGAAWGAAMMSAAIPN